MRRTLVLMVVFAACSGGPQDTVAQLDPDTTAVPAVKAESVFKPLPSFNYTDVPALWKVTAGAFCDIARGVVVTECASRAVETKSDGSDVGLVFVTVDARRRGSADPGPRTAALADELRPTSQTPPESLDLDGTGAVYAHSREGGPLAHIVAWAHGGQTTIQVRGAERAPTEAVARELAGALKEDG